LPKHQTDQDSPGIVLAESEPEEHRIGCAEKGEDPSEVNARHFLSMGMAVVFGMVQRIF
jgi:hypothetical protein